MKWRHNTPLRYSKYTYSTIPLDHIDNDVNTLEVEVPTPLTTPAPRNPVKPGVHTTEFYLTVLADIVAVLNADQVWTFLNPHTAGIIGAVVTAAYTLSRGWAKSGS